jgi:ABC-type nitrate/sulfonate/bicarbonate transport system substrate-binding protein
MNRFTLLARTGGLAAAAFVPTVVSAQGAPALGVLRLGTPPSTNSTPIVYGLKLGLFARAGLDVQITKATSGAAVAAAVIGGAADLGNSSTMTLFEAHDHGVPITLVVPTQIYNPQSPNGAFIVLKDAPLNSGKDWENQTVGIAAQGDIGSVALRSWIDQRGGDSKTLKFAEVPATAAAVAVEERRVVAGEITHPALGAALASGKFRAVTVFDVFGRFAASAWFTTKENSAKRPEAIKAFCRAYAEAATLCNARPADTVEAVAEFTGQTPALIRSIPAPQFGPRLEITQFQLAIDIGAKYGAIKKAFPAREMFDANIA